MKNNLGTWIENILQLIRWHTALVEKSVDEQLNTMMEPYEVVYGPAISFAGVL